MCVVASASVLAACTKPNPFLDDDGGSSGTTQTSSATGTSPTSATTATTSGDPTTSGPMTMTTADASSSSTTDDMGPTTEDDSDDTVPVCGSDRVCVSPVPAGWSGPVVWANTPSEDEDPQCPDLYPEQQVEAFDDLQAAPASCECECNNAVGVECGQVVAEYHGTNSACSGSPDEQYVVSGSGCDSSPSTSPNRYWSVDAPGVMSGSCDAVTNETVPPATWATHSTLCGGASSMPGLCAGGGLCLPTPADGFESRICVWQPGALECPSGDYSDPFVRYGSFEDERNCATCTCGSPTGDCTGTVSLFYSSNCSGAVGGSVQFGGSCLQTAGTTTQFGINSIRRSSTTPLEDVSCEPSIGTAVGEAAPADPITLCCTSV